MTVGLPGSGIGGILYLLLGLLMPLHELWVTLQGRSNWQRWRVVASQWCLCAGVLASLWVEGWALKTGFARLTAQHEVSSTLAHTAAVGTMVMVPTLAIMPFCILGSMLVLLHLARVVVPIPARLVVPVPEHSPRAPF